jgi:nucleoid-associated protein YgaU
VDDGGRWALELAGVEPGVRRLRLDELRDDGTVARRIETPFQRDIPAAASAPGAAPRPAAIIVQPGNTLWTLARIHYGSGVLYTRIYAQNDGLIGDPDLIYPGQIFVLPEGASATTAADAPKPRPAD